MSSVCGGRVDFRHIGMSSKNKTYVGMCGITGTEVAKEAGTCFAFTVKDEEVKRGYLHPSRAEAPWCDSVGKLVHMLSKLCLLLGDVRLVFSGFWYSSYYTAWKGTGERKKKRKMSSLPPTLIVGLCMMEHRPHGYLNHLQFHQMKRRRNVKHFATCISEEVKTLFSCLDPSGFSLLC